MQSNETHKSYCVGRDEWRTVISGKELCGVLLRFPRGHKMFRGVPLTPLENAL